MGYQIDMQWDANKLPGAEQALLRQSCIRWSRRSPPAPEPKDCCQGVVGDGIVAWVHQMGCRMDRRLTRGTRRLCQHKYMRTIKVVLTWYVWTDRFENVSDLGFHDCEVKVWRDNLVKDSRVWQRMSAQGTAASSLCFATVLCIYRDTQWVLDNLVGIYARTILGSFGLTPILASGLTPAKAPNPRWLLDGCWVVWEDRVGFGLLASTEGLGRRSCNALVHINGVRRLDFVYWYQVFILLYEQWQGEWLHLNDRWSRRRTFKTESSWTTCKKSTNSIRR